jgi:predicted DNA-binding protein
MYHYHQPELSMPPIKTSRSVPLKVTITPELHERLREVAAQLGQAPATVASIAIGQYVSQMSRSLGAVETVSNALVAQMGPELQRQMKLMEDAPDRRNALQRLASPIEDESQNALLRKPLPVRKKR